VRIFATRLLCKEPAEVPGGASGAGGQRVPWVRAVPTVPTPL
jgi:hypothetical protein